MTAPKTDAGCLKAAHPGARAGPALHFVPEWFQSVSEFLQP